MDIEDTSSTPAGLMVGGNCVAGACPSDRGLKQNIRYLTGSLETIERLKPATFRYKRYPKKEAYGLIAQDVQEVMPNLVSRDKDGFMRVDYSPMEMMLLGSMKELHAEIKSLKARVDELEAQEQLSHPAQCFFAPSRIPGDSGD